ncbi:glutamine--fructose-6-phosphate transaminase (isomerizing) [Pyrococcus horikoshii]|uniref:Glutamine--fructose-6-phosphate aminotransferase [isomerizing] n=2 Tax=Pyrococcus horikoshii TaxID=53953 RepID=GLMS_PYRHO|nr:glutamine--fructose-6-phosphate transaminase (isomerizing) [Pyrococcus horikoshii]O57981.3 RecName: Full=Glutamine--fructose-6-phosphate aminotransferase [isomerizing]; AltName: Full=D-fructose-6-phosphate amidotransferase; AltName: Full=GFAT; AltName: Full=Glucosamine-6-phosphate synthase; AltName: Full=Hexosephosphate aminotransferase; AltName: Full=L-glutamine--D-fructose-6-phosphate amidotransferase [Pyrococcus horikoshii OT3]HII61164.1 glutamine--fructose-6-phosphate transaminase (isomeri
MCGIIGYIGPRKASDVIVEGLKRLEYRGYDSAGIATCYEGKIFIKKGAGKIDELVKKLNFLELPGNIGIGHTRWATHGIPNDTNAHPHTDCTGKIVVVHNGIIENFQELKRELLKRGHVFRSDTDTEVIAHLIEENLRITGNFEDAFRMSLLRLRGSYALVVLFADDPERLYIARKDSPLIIGIGKGEMFMASDIPAFLAYTRRAVFLDDGEYGIVSKDWFTIKDIITGAVKTKEIHEIQWTLEMAEKGGYEHFMLKEIFEQPKAIKDAIYGNVKEAPKVAELLMKYDRIIITGMGTSYHAALVGKYLIQRFGKVPVIVEEASELRYEYEDILDNRSLLIAITQSGETADTVAAMKLAKSKGVEVVGIVNVVGSLATRIADETLYTHAGPEIGVAATKTYTTQLVVLTLLAKELGKLVGIDVSQIEGTIPRLPELVDSSLKINDKIREIAVKLNDKRDFFYIGRGINYPTALEGALKIKEIAYVHAEGLSAGELKHGPLALIEDGIPVVGIAPTGKTFEKMLSNIEEAKARGGFIISLGDDVRLHQVSDIFIRLPKVPEELAPITYIVPLQLLAYHLAVLKGHNPDRPRNLAKSVTVE